MLHIYPLFFTLLWVWIILHRAKTKSYRSHLPVFHPPIRHALHLKYSNHVVFFANIEWPDNTQILNQSYYVMLAVWMICVIWIVRWRSRMHCMSPSIKRPPVYLEISIKVSSSVLSSLQSASINIHQSTHHWERKKCVFSESWHPDLNLVTHWTRSGKIKINHWLEAFALNYHFIIVNNYLFKFIPLAIHHLKPSRVISIHCYFRWNFFPPIGTNLM